MFFVTVCVLCWYMRNPSRWPPVFRQNEVILTVLSPLTTGVFVYISYSQPLDWTMSTAKKLPSVSDSLVQAPAALLTR